MKSVGHGDCYVVISDGRVILIDLGPTSSVNGLVSLLKMEYSHYDRIVITHVHSDHVGGLITAEQYANQAGTALSADMLVSNHGAHDLNLIIRESKLRSLLTELRNQPIVGMNDEAIAKLALNDENIEVRGIALNNAIQKGNENKSSLIIKVTEIRDGKRRATLFLGDIELSQQSELFSHPDAKEIFRDVGAITLPHHGRTTTLASDFFTEVKRLAGNDVVVLHSDINLLDRQIAMKATKAGVNIKSTASATKKGADVLVNLFKEKTYYTVGQKPTKLSTVVKNEKRHLITVGDFTEGEIVKAVSKYCNREVSVSLKPKTIISMPSDEWITSEITKEREAFNQETERLISQLQSRNLEQRIEADKALSSRFLRLSKEQINRINKISPELIERWEIQNASPVVRQIQNGLGNGWVVVRNPNIDEKKLFLHGSKDRKDNPKDLRFLVREESDNIWTVFKPGSKNSKGVISYGKLLDKMRRPNGVTITDRNVCEYCGKEAYGWCHMREKYVCEDHRYFTQGTTNWICP